MGEGLLFLTFALRMFGCRPRASFPSPGKRATTERKTVCGRSGSRTPMCGCCSIALGYSRGLARSLAPSCLGSEEL